MKQEGLPDDFAPPKAGAPSLGGDKKPNVLNKTLGKALKPFNTVAKKTVAGPMSLMEKSAALLKKGGAELDPESDAFDAEAALKAQMEDRNELIFAEYVFMMRAGTLKQFLPGDWQERAEAMRKLREAFNAADVDGDNQLELEELEMCVISMNPKANINPADVRAKHSRSPICWAVCASL